MREAEWTIEAPAPGASGTIYVHLCSGAIRKIEDVEEISMTDAHVIFTRENLEAVIIDRREIYYSSCEAGDSPPAY